MDLTWAWHVQEDEDCMGCSPASTGEPLKDFKQIEMWESTDQNELPAGSMEK